MKVFKYSVPIEDVQDIVHFQMPEQAIILSVINQNILTRSGVRQESLCTYALVDEKRKLVSRKFRIAGTGHPVDDLAISGAWFIGTVAFRNDSFILHVWDLGEVR